MQALQIANSVSPCLLQPLRSPVEALVDAEHRLAALMLTRDVAAATEQLHRTLRLRRLVAGKAVRS